MRKRSAKNFKISFDQTIVERIFYDVLDDNIALESRVAMHQIFDKSQLSNQLLNFLHIKKINLSNNFMSKIASEDCSYSAKQNINIAVITEHKALFGMLRQYQTYTDFCNVKMKIFKNYQDAKAWLLKPVASC